MFDHDNIEGYTPMFELGLFEEDSPACRILDNNIELNPITLAALSLALFETAMNSVSEENQIEFEKRYLQAFDIMLKQRFEYDLIKKYPETD